jgi:hypothetical protein
MPTVTLRISNLPSQAAASRKTLAFASLEGNDIVLKSQLDSRVSLNDHLVWLWGIVQGERRYLKSLQAEGAIISVKASGNTDPIELKPSGAEMLHLLGATLVIGGAK